MEKFAQLDSITDEIMLRLHACVAATTYQMLRRHPQDVAEVMGGLLGALVHELMIAAAEANVVLGGDNGQEIVTKMMQIFEDGVRSRTLHLTHVIDEMQGEGVDDGHSAP